MSAAEVTIEVNDTRDGVPVRRDHSQFLIHALDGLSDERRVALSQLGYQPGDFATKVFQQSSGRRIVALSFWTDSEIALYQHKRLDFTIPFIAPHECPVAREKNVTALTRADKPPWMRDNHWLFDAIDTLAADYEFIGLIDGATFKSNLRRVLAATPRHVCVFIIRAAEDWSDPESAKWQHYPQRTNLNEWIADVACSFPNVSVLDPVEHIRPGEMQTIGHFSRMVYFRLYEAMLFSAKAHMHLIR